MIDPVKASGINRIDAVVHCADGKTRNLGRIDRKWWAPRVWFYRYVTFPRLRRKYGDGLHKHG